MAAPAISTANMTLSTLMAGGAGVGLFEKVWPVALAGLAGTAKVIDNYTFGCNGRLVSVNFHCTVPASTASKLATITPSLDGVNVTGGVLALTTALCTAGAIVAGSAITALNTFTPTALFDLTLSAVTAFIEGSGAIVVRYYNDDLINALAMALGGLRNP